MTDDGLSAGARLRRPSEPIARASLRAKSGKAVDRDSFQSASGVASECGDSIALPSRPPVLLPTSIARWALSTAVSFGPAATWALRATTLAMVNDARLFRLDVD
jgi:hypothetical protein